jgi:AcrR family transcriptional regulator
MSAVAEEAGVTRATLYRHFPTERDLFAACTRDWLGAHPPPDADAWRGIADPARRLRFALGELYRWYEATEAMTSNVLRDLDALPEVNRARIAERFEAQVAALLDGPLEDEPDAAAAASVAISFESWRAMARSGRGPDEAADLMTRMVVAIRG